jgi:hypothetical protein
MGQQLDCLDGVSNMAPFGVGALELEQTGGLRDNGTEAVGHPDTSGIAANPMRNAAPGTV